jgi:hypothetical protein
VYVVLSAVALVTLALQVRSLLGVGRWRAKIQERGVARAVLSTLWKMAFGVFILLILPWLLVQTVGPLATKVNLCNYLPDLSLWLGLLAALSLDEGVVRGWDLLRVRRG